MATPVFDFDRALNALLYVANRVERRDIHKIFKILYFADMHHLLKYGRTITGDRYIAMKYGPVPSSIYDMVKTVRGDSWYIDENLKAFFSIQGQLLEPLRDADMDYLSDSDVAEIENAIKTYKDADFKELTRLSHDSAWKKTWDSPSTDEISVEDILHECKADEEYISYIVENITAQKELNR